MASLPELMNPQIVPANQINGTQHRHEDIVYEPTEASPSMTANLDIFGQLAAISARLEAVEKSQEHLQSELQLLKEKSGPADTADLEKKIDDLSDIVKLNQNQLPSRLHNALLVEKRQKMLLKVPPTANGKPPPNFPGTRGEFEHLTQERYEVILKAYGQSGKGDLSERRERLRAFLGIPTW